MREKLRSLPTFVVIVIAILMAAGFADIMRLIGAGVAHSPQIMAWPDSAVNLMAEVIVSLYAVALMALTGHLYGFRDKGKGWLVSTYIGGFFVCYCTLELAAQSYMQAMDTEKTLLPPGQILMFVLTMFLIGVAEEGVFRGAILNMLLDRFPKSGGGIVAAVVLDGVLFGALHMSNYFAGVELVPAIIQSVGAGALGLVFAAIYARSRNLWVPIIAHALVDFAGLMGSGIYGKGTEVDAINDVSPYSLIATVVFLIPVIVLLRPSKLREMAQEAQGIGNRNVMEEVQGIQSRNVTEAAQEIQNRNVTESRMRLAIASLVLGIIGFFAACVGGYGIGLAICGILAAALSLQEKHPNQGLAIGGLVVSIVASVGSLIMIALMLVVYANLGDEGLQEIQDMLNGLQGWISYFRI